MGNQAALALTVSWLVVGMVSADNAAGAEFCEHLNGLADALVQKTDVAPDQGFALPAYRAAEAGCGRSLGQDGRKSLNCMWTFDYRSDAAMQAFDTLLDGVAGCGNSEPRQEGGVNHPDSYDLRMFEVGGQRVSVSLKDKGASRQTLVFLNVSGSQSDPQ